jgi:hypothetical protein
VHRNDANPGSRNYSLGSLEILTACLKQMEATVLGLKELRNYAGTDIGSRMLAILIEEAEENIAEIKQTNHAPVRSRVMCIDGNSPVLQ